MKYICRVCGYVYSVENNEADYQDVMDLLPEDFECTDCGATKGMFEPKEESTPGA